MDLGDDLLRRLAQLRRRLRGLAAIEGAVVGLAAAGSALAVAVALVRGRGGTASLRWVAPVLAAGGMAGALAWAARRISLVRCARLADAALDGQDRVLSALDLASAHGPLTPFARALIADAARRATALVPGAAAPTRRPRGLPAMGAAALALAAASLIPLASRAARRPSPTPRVSRQAPLPAGALDAERELARDAAATASRLGDARLAAQAADFARALDRISRGEIDDGQALDLLRELAAQAAEGARAAGREGRAAEAETRALQAEPETRAAAQALGDPTASEDAAAAALSAAAQAHPSETARALGAAARAMTGNMDAGDDQAGAAGQRRLAREGTAESANGSGASGGRGDDQTRHLEQLRRNLDDTAAACQDGDPSCRARAEARGRDLAQLGREGAAQESLERLSRSADQLRARVGRGELRDDDGHAMRSFARAASGAPSSPPGAAPGNAPGNAPEGAPSAGGRDSAGGEASGASGTTTAETPGGASAAHPGADTGAGAGEAEAEAALAGAGSSPAGEQGTGAGIGKQAGGAPLGGRASAPGARGNDAEVAVADGAGPNRAEVIGSAAGHGFDSRGYARMFTDYSAAVEQTLSATAVPEGKRYVVRRYFELIRPRAPAHRGRP